MAGRQLQFPSKCKQSHIKKHTPSAYKTLKDHKAEECVKRSKKKKKKRERKAGREREKKKSVRNSNGSASLCVFLLIFIFLLPTHIRMLIATPILMASAVCACVATPCC